MKCQVCNSIDLPVLDMFSMEEKHHFISGVFNKSITYETLDLSLHMKVSKAFQSVIETGFGSGKNKELLESLIDSAYIFSAAKQYQLVRELLKLDLTNWQAYEKPAIDLFHKYYVTYLSVELDSAEYQAKGAKTFSDQIIWANG